MIRRVTRNRRLLRKRMYRSPHSRHRVSQYYRENKNLAKPHQDKFKEMNGPRIKRKRRPKREVIHTDTNIIKMMMKIWKKNWMNNSSL